MTQQMHNSSFCSLNNQWEHQVNSRQLTTEHYQKNGNNLHNPQIINQKYIGINDLAKKFQLKIKLLESSTSAARISDVDSIKDGWISDNIEHYLEIISFDPDNNSVFLKVLGQKEERIGQAIANDCCLIVENEKDCQTVQYLGSILGKKVKVGMWLNQSPLKNQKQAFPIDNLELIADIFPLRYPNLNFEGFHLNINQLSIRKKFLGLKQGLLLAELLHRAGINTSYIHLNDSILSKLPRKLGNLSVFHNKSKSSAGYFASDPVRLGYLTQIDRQESEKHFKRRNGLNDTLKAEAYLEKILIQPFSYQELIFQALRSRGITLIVE